MPGRRIHHHLTQLRNLIPGKTADRIRRPAEDHSSRFVQLSHEQYQVRRHLNWSLIHTRAKPLADFLAERHIMDAAERSVTLVRRISHEDVRLSVDAAIAGV